ncbi:MAG: DUF721 domain-containing protein, partial [Sphingomonas sp.]
MGRPRVAATPAASDSSTARSSGSAIVCRPSPISTGTVRSDGGARRGAGDGTSPCRIATRASKPESIRFAPGKKDGGTLTLTCHGAHAVMIQHIQPEIIERVNRFFGYPAVARVAIRQGEVPSPAPRRAPPSLRTVP